ncbi:MAG: hypothetical protein KJ607_01720 [Bacteroidetes bacterium]|nr:hypothetical protein [Bacteroidota bacterium]
MTTFIRTGLIILMFIALVQKNSSGQTYEFENSSDERFLLNDSINFGGFLAVSPGLSQVTAKKGFTTGGSGAIIFGRHLFAGGYYSALVSKIVLDRGLSENKQLRFNHGGILAGFIFLPDRRISPEVGIMIGWGSLALTQPEEKKYLWESFDRINTYSFFVETDYRVTNFIRAGLGLSYRIACNSGLDSYTDNDFSGLSVFFSIKIVSVSGKSNSSHDPVSGGSQDKN